MPTIPGGKFQISPATLPDHDRDVGTVIDLSPRPTYPDYGERLRITTHETEGRLVTQVSKKNPREKRWVWEGYGPNIPLYNTLYDTIFSHQSHIRDGNGLSPYVYLKETVTEQFGTYTVSGTFNADWVRCRIINVDRTISRRGGYPVFDETILTFTVDDDSFDIK